MNEFDLVVIGGGPAGLTAGIYGVRAGLSTMVFTGTPAQSQITLTSEVENYPGFPEPTPGAVILGKMSEQAERLGTKILDKAVTDIDTKSSPFKITAGETTYTANAVIIATGAKSKKLGIPGEDKFLGRGVSICATCDGAFFKGKTVAVIGGGDTAAAEAITLASFASKVYIIHRRNTLRTNALHLKRIKENPAIEILTPYTVREIGGNTKVEKLVLERCEDADASAKTSKDVTPPKTDNTKELPVDGVFVAVGYVPETELVQGKLELTENGRIKTHDGAATSVPGIFAAGDVSDCKYQQAIVAAASGAKAALDASEYLQTHEQKK